MTEQFLQEINQPKHKDDDPTDDISKNNLIGWTEIKKKETTEEEDAELPRKE